MANESNDNLIFNKAPKYIDDVESKPLREKIKTREFLHLFIVSLFGSAVMMFNIIDNLDVVEFQVGHSGLAAGWLISLSLIFAILTPFMIYEPYIIERRNKKRSVIHAFYVYTVTYIFWSSALFHSRVNRGTALFASVLFLASLVWLGWCCYNEVKDTIFIFLLLLLWVIYLQYYTYQVSRYPWTPMN